MSSTLRCKHGGHSDKRRTYILNIAPSETTHSHHDPTRLK